MTRSSPRSTRPLLAIVAAAALVLAACGSDDEEAGSTTSPATTAESATAASTSTQAPDTTVSAVTTDAPATSGAPATSLLDEPDNATIVDSIDDMPRECVDVLIETLQLLEPAVSEIDWETATLNDFQALTDEFETELGDIEQRTTEAGCDQYDFASDEESLAVAIELAEQEAPGTVGWLEFLGQLSFEASGSAADGPQDCASAIAFVEARIAEGETLMNSPVADMTAASQALTVISQDCSAEESTAFFARDDVTTFLQS